MYSSRARRFVLLFVAALASCGKSESPTATVVTPGGNRPVFPPILANFTGAFAERFLSGSITANVTADSAHGTLVFLNGSSVPMAGPYFPSSGAFGLAGGNGYQLSGFLSNGVISGTMGGLKGHGRFSIHTVIAAGASKSYCGTYIASNDYGWLGAVISASGTFTGFLVGAGGGTSLGLTGSVSGANITATTSTSVPVQATLTPDASSIAGSYGPAGATAGSLQASNTACGTQGATNTAGLWIAAADTGVVGNKWSINVILTEASDVLSGGGAITASYVPGWTSDEFKITSGAFTDVDISFVAQLGANPDGQGGLYYGSLSFTGVIASPTTITGSVAWTPPRTTTQTFVEQRLPNITFVRF